MKRNRKPNRLGNYNYASDNLYFVTSCVQNRICCFGEIVGTGRDLSQRMKIKSLSELMGAYKTSVSKQIHLLGLLDFAWQRSFYDHIIRNGYSFNLICDYIRNNPLKWEQDRFFIR